MGVHNLFNGIAQRMPEAKFWIMSLNFIQIAIIAYVVTNSVLFEVLIFLSNS